MRRAAPVTVDGARVAGDKHTVTDATPSPTYSCPQTPIEVTIAYELAQLAGGVQVAVVTNLPDGSEVMTSFIRESPSYLGQDTQGIQDGRATYGPFSDDGVPLRGGFALSISLSVARTQPHTVADLHR